jgi:RNA polymerase sigma factor (sigma-70 family)
MGEVDFTRHYRMIRSRVEYFFPRASAPDVVQEAYAETLRYSRRSHRPVDDPLSLFWRIATRVAQRRGFWKIYLPSRAERNACGLQEMAEPSAHAAAEEECKLVCSAIERLTSAESGAIRGHYLEGKECAELARDAGVGESAIKSRLYRARQKLRDSLGEWGSGY